LALLEKRRAWLEPSSSCRVAENLGAKNELYRTAVGDVHGKGKSHSEGLLLGDAADSVFYIREGQVKLYIVSELGKEAKERENSDPLSRS
jgi:CRP-like cAMP-binding protein